MALCTTAAGARARHRKVVDFVGLLQDRLGHGGEVVPVVFVLKSALPRDAVRLSRALAQRLGVWADQQQRTALVLVQP